MLKVHLCQLMASIVAVFNCHLVWVCQLVISRLISGLDFNKGIFYTFVGHFPILSEEEIQDASKALHCAILEHLKSKSSLPTVIAFKHAHFNFLFKNKEQKTKDSRCILLESADFQQCRFPDQWKVIIDSIGDGVKIDFSVKVRLFLSWSPITHTLTRESIVPFPRYRLEKLRISFCKVLWTLSWHQCKEMKSWFLYLKLFIDRNPYLCKLIQIYILFLYICFDEGLKLEMSAFTIPVSWQVFIINSVVKTICIC